MSQYLTGKYSHWYFPLRASYPKYKKDYLDKFIGKNPYHDDNDRERFMQQLFDSLSLSIHLKKQTFDIYPKLSITQLCDLDAVWEEEAEKFKELNLEYPQDIEKLVSKRSIFWLLSLPGIDDRDVLLQELFYSCDFDTGTIKLALEYIHLELQDKPEYVYAMVFENYVHKDALPEDAWNKYLVHLCNIKQYRKVLDVKLPPTISTKFLEACKVSYLLQRTCYDQIKPPHIEKVISYIRSEKRVPIRNQFLKDLYYFYFFKDRNFKKLARRLTRIFKRSISETDISCIPFKSAFKPMLYIRELLMLSTRENAKPFIQFYYLIFIRKLELIEYYKGDTNTSDFYALNSNFSLLFHQFFINIDSLKYIHKIKERNDNISIKPSVGLYYSALTSKNKNELEPLIHSVLKGGSTLDFEESLDMYIFLKKNSMDNIAELVISKERDIFENSNMDELAKALFEEANNNQHVLNDELEALKNTIKEYSNKYSLRNVNSLLPNKSEESN